MLTEHEKFVLLDSNKKHKLYAEVNWRADDPLTNECKVIKFTCPGGEEVYVPRKLLLEMLFVIGSPEEKSKMIPQTLTHTRWYETVLSVKATKDIRRGESITFPVKLSLPEIQQDVIGEVRPDKVHSNIPIIGR